MPLYLNTTGLSSLAIAVCDRCKMKKPWSYLVPDPNSPGLRVCPDGCVDEFDPYRLPARQPDRITLAWARPDTSLATRPAGIITEDGNAFLITEDGDWSLLP